MSSIDTCDHCRSRKVRCVLPDLPAVDPAALEGQPRTGSGRCANCVRREEACTFDYRFKKPGRPRGSTKRTHSQTRSKSPVPIAGPSEDAQVTDTSHGDTQVYDEHGPTFGSIFGSARLALDPPAPPGVSFNYTLPYDAETNNPASLTSQPNASWVSPTTTTSSGAAEPILSNDPHVPFPQIGAFATWEQVGFFLSLHMRHQHVLTPLVHQPSFARDLLHRRDINDEPFRGLLLSIVAYTICQVPIHMLLGQMSKPQLEALCRRCQRASRAIQVRHQMKPNLVTLTSTTFDWITSQAIGQDALRENLMSDVRRLNYSLGLHLANPPSTDTAVDVEIGRRLYWEAYAMDKTNALNGHTIALPDFEGIPPFPIEVDDEYITPESTLSQPPSRLSFMCGFITISRVFQILSQTIMRQRTLRINPSAGPDRPAVLEWIETTTNDLRTLMEGLPEQLRQDYTSDMVFEGSEGSTRSLYATQQANIQITALCLELCLLDLKAVVTEGQDVVIDRKSIAEKAFKQLSIIPIDCIASNGESMRGKVLRVILALLSEDNSEQFSSELWDWWNMASRPSLTDFQWHTLLMFSQYSRVQFLQVIPDSQTGPASPTMAGGAA